MTMTNDYVHRFHHYQSASSQPVISYHQRPVDQKLLKLYGTQCKYTNVVTIYGYTYIAAYIMHTILEVVYHIYTSSYICGTVEYT